MWRRLAAVATIAISGCYTGGTYGYDRHYIPRGAERQLMPRVQSTVYAEVRTDPQDFSDRLVSWFGVVETLGESSGEVQPVVLSFRSHQERHLCADLERETCRVTVSQASSGNFTASIRPREEDLDGRNQIGVGSLLRVYCNVTGEYDADGGPMLDCEHYRHWPRGQWAHTGMRDQLRR